MYLPLFAEVIFKNAILSKYAAGRTQYFEGIHHIQRQMCDKLLELYMQFIDWPFIKYDFLRAVDNP